jgi:hypothetical protein
MTGIEEDTREREERRRALTKEGDEKETVSMMTLSNLSLLAVLEEEPDLYTPEDLKVVYR